MEAQRGCALTKLEKRVFLQVIASQVSKTLTLAYATMYLLVKKKKK